MCCARGGVVDGADVSALALPPLPRARSSLLGESLVLAVIKKKEEEVRAPDTVRTLSRHIRFLKKCLKVICMLAASLLLPVSLALCITQR